MLPITIAEASKIIENSQRDVNIAFMNELAKIFNAMGIDTHDVIEAAASKWNFIKLSPGLVGGHCISVDPYYLIQKAQVYGVLPRVMFSARRLNDGMGDYVAGCCYYQALLAPRSGVSILGNTFRLNNLDESVGGRMSITDKTAPVAQKAAMLATYNMWEVMNPEDYPFIHLFHSHQ